MVYELQKREKAASIFAGWEETIIWSCQQGVMGKIYVTSAENPVSAAALLGDFCFLAGKPDRELLTDSLQAENREFIILVPRDKVWAELIEGCFPGQAKRAVRYAIKKEPETFDMDRLSQIVGGLQEGYVLKMMDEKLFSYARKTSWCRDWVSQYRDYAMYQKYGLGAVILKDGEPVSGASSYSSYIGGIEIEIDTREDYRRRGLASVCGAKLILECLKKGWYPSWDAQNKWSVSLAEKLGYHLDSEYTVYEVLQGEMKDSRV